MKNKLLSISFILIGYLAFSQTATVKGKIINNNKQPLFGVNISVNNTTHGAQTNKTGEFQITNLTDGDYVLSVSYIGFKTKEINLNINTSRDLGNITIYEGNELLQEVIIDSNRKNMFSRKKSAYVAKLPLKNIENSQVYSTITNQLLTSQLVTNFEDALKNAVGVDKLWSSTGRSGDGAGYYSIRGFSVQPQLVNGVPGITNGFINPSNVERVEVIKGPSATLFGSSVSSYGGLINIVTKKPYNGNGGSISLVGGSFGFKKLNFDINLTDVQNKNFSFRFNGGYQKEDSFQDTGFKNSLFIAPAISYKANNKLTFNVSYEASSNEQTNYVSLFLNRYGPIAYNTIEGLNYNTDKSLTSNDVSIKNPTQNYRGEAAYKISDNWSSQTIIAGGTAKSKGYYTYLWNYADWSDPVNPVGTENYNLYAQQTDAQTNTFDIQQNFTGDFKIGNIRNKILVGIDYLDTQIIDNSSNWGYLQTVNPQGEVLAGPEVNANNLNTALSGLGNVNTDTNQNVLGVYISDVFNILPNLSAMASARYDRFQYKGDANDTSDDSQAYTESTFSPKFGIVFQPISNQLSIFVNYQNGFSYVNPEIVPIDPTDLTAGSKLQSFKLERANQLEFGIKTQLFNDKLEATVSYYDITVEDKIMGFGVSKIQDGTINSKGFEIEINANPINGLNVRGGFSYNNAEVTASESRPDLIGLRLAEAGSKINYNFWGDYKFLNNFAKNFGIGAGFNGSGDYDTMVGYPVAGEFILPSYTIFNGTVYFDTTKFRIGVKVNNITDKDYYKGWSTVTPQQPRAFLVDFTYKF